MFAGLCKFLKHWILGNPPHDFGLRSPREMERILTQERQRADRGHNRFSLVAFTSTHESWGGECTEQLAEIVSRRLRMTDQVGWLDRRRIGLILPGTSADGARTLADDVCSQFPKKIPAPLYSVVTYPDNEPRMDGPSGGNAESAERSSRTSHSVGVRLSAEPPSSVRPFSHSAQALFAAKPPIWKRALDVCAAGVALILLSPLMALVALVIKCSSPGPVFFSQMRSGLGGRQFRMYKFRSMVVDAEARKQDLMAINEQDGPAFKVRNDPRVTRVGRFLRTTSIDELPQLWNVVRGEMSLVGPRPLPCNETAGCELWQRRRLDALPGLTCIWQVHGRSKVTFDEWVRMDIEYVRSRSLWNDIKLILQTVPAVLWRHGAH